MDNVDKVYTNQTIPDVAFPTDPDATTVTEVVPGGTASTPSGNSTIPEQDWVKQQIAAEVISVALNTRSKKILGEFEFTPSGAIQIGIFTIGVNGDIRIDPAGIIARNSLGDTTFALDGETGDATFRGTIEAGSVISPTILANYIQVGGAGADIQGTGINGVVNVKNSSVIIDGTNGRILINDGSNNRIVIGAV